MFEIQPVVSWAMYILLLRKIFSHSVFYKARYCYTAKFWRGSLVYMNHGEESLDEVDDDTIEEDGVEASSASDGHITAVDFPKRPQSTCVERQIFNGVTEWKIFDKTFNNHLKFSYFNQN